MITKYNRFIFVDKVFNFFNAVSELKNTKLQLDLANVKIQQMEKELVMYKNKYELYRTILEKYNEEFNQILKY